MMKELKQIKGIAHYAGLGGLNVVNFSSKSNSGTIFCQLEPWEDRKDKELQLQGLMATVQQRMAKPQGSQHRWLFRRRHSGPGQQRAASRLFCRSAKCGRRHPDL